MPADNRCKLECFDIGLAIVEFLRVLDLATFRATCTTWNAAFAHIGWHAAFFAQFPCVALPMHASGLLPHDWLRAAAKHERYADLQTVFKLLRKCGLEHTLKTLQDLFQFSGLAPQFTLSLVSGLQIPFDLTAVLQCNLTLGSELDGKNIGNHSLEFEENTGNGTLYCNTLADTDFRFIFAPLRIEHLDEVKWEEQQLTDEQLQEALATVLFDSTMICWFPRQFAIEEWDCRWDVPEDEMTTAEEELLKCTSYDFKMLCQQLATRFPTNTPCVWQWRCKNWRLLAQP
eukprot:TRINITY_DN19424_c0_g1_i1.p1 TRINITY_DN19424_c0_g1~~TRINITY_DN19424_c0_g1_i1.p1  ORF type:complete len:287 (-),score=13.06 TRINITY_DN19424_c0_g1_i1:14-874(-)